MSKAKKIRGKNPGHCDCVVGFDYKRRMGIKCKNLATHVWWPEDRPEGSNDCLTKFGCRVCDECLKELESPPEPRP